LLTWTLRSLIFAMMIVYSMISALCNYRFSNTWCLYLKKTKIFSSKKLIRLQWTKQFIRDSSSLFRQRYDALSMQMRRYSFVLLLNAKSIWRITCHFICFFRRFLSCIEIIKQNDFHRNWRTFVFQSTLCMCYRDANSRKSRNVVRICMIFWCDRNINN
jgi:hypothetical protein